MSEYMFIGKSEPAPLRVGDVCRDFDKLRKGVVIEWKNGSAGTAFRSTLTEAKPIAWTGPEPLWHCVENNGAFAREFVEEYGVTILALPEEPKVQPSSNPCQLPAAPSLDELVPVGSRWRWDEYGAKEYAGESLETTPFTVTATKHGRVAYLYDGARYDGNRPKEQFLAHATRIDEPAKGEAKKLCNAQWGFRYTCDLYAGHDGEHRDQLVEKRAGLKVQPAPPPARCAPGCVPASPCMTMRWPFKCPGYVEPEANRWNEDQALMRTEATPDQREAAQWRGRQHEPMTSGLGGLVGRFRFDRRPR